jgi:hypothetical protein
MAPEVVATLGEDRVQLVTVDVQRHQHRRVGAAVDLERDGVLRREQHPLEVVADG